MFKKNIFSLQESIFFNKDVNYLQIKLPNSQDNKVFLSSISLYNLSNFFNFSKENRKTIIQKIQNLLLQFDEIFFLKINENNQNKYSFIDINESYINLNNKYRYIEDSPVKFVDEITKLSILNNLINDFNLFTANYYLILVDRNINKLEQLINDVVLFLNENKLEAKKCTLIENFSLIKSIFNHYDELPLDVFKIENKIQLQNFLNIEKIECDKEYIKTNETYLKLFNLPINNENWLDLINKIKTNNIFSYLLKFNKKDNNLILDNFIFLNFAKKLDDLKEKNELLSACFDNIKLDPLVKKQDINLKELFVNNKERNTEIYFDSFFDNYLVDINKLNQINFKKEYKELFLNFGELKNNFKFNLKENSTFILSDDKHYFWNIFYDLKAKEKSFCLFINNNDFEELNFNNIDTYNLSELKFNIFNTNNIKIIKEFFIDYLKINDNFNLQINQELNDLLLQYLNKNKRKNNFVDFLKFIKENNAENKYSKLFNILSSWTENELLKILLNDNDQNAFINENNNLIIKINQDDIDQNNLILINYVLKIYLNYFDNFFIYNLEKMINEKVIDNFKYKHTFINSKKYSLSKEDYNLISSFYNIIIKPKQINYDFNKWQDLLIGLSIDFKEDDLIELNNNFSQKALLINNKNIFWFKLINDLDIEIIFKNKENNLKYLSEHLHKIQFNIYNFINYNKLNIKKFINKAYQSNELKENINKTNIKYINGIL